MARHRRARDPQSPGPLRRRAAVLRGGTLAVTIALCLAGSLKLFLSASVVADGAHAASLRGSRHATLVPPPVKQHARTGTRRSPQQVSGQLITAVGDSVMVASAPALQDALPGISIDAMVGRQFGAGLQIIASLKEQGLLRPIVVVGLGTNGPVTADEITTLFAEIGPDRKLVLVNTFDDRPWEAGVNATLAAAVSDHPGVVLANWYTTVEHRTDLLWPDGIHPQPAGCVVYAHMLEAALGRLVNLRS